MLSVIQFLFCHLYCLTYLHRSNTLRLELQLLAFVGALGHTPFPGALQDKRYFHAHLSIPRDTRFNGWQICLNLMIFKIHYCLRVDKTTPSSIGILLAAIFKIYPEGWTGNTCALLKSTGWSTLICKELSVSAHSDAPYYDTSALCQWYTQSLEFSFRIVIWIAWRFQLDRFIITSYKYVRATYHACVWYDMGCIVHCVKLGPWQGIGLSIMP